MRLAAPTAVLAATGIQANAGTLVTAEAMLDISYPIIESLLETSLTRKAVIDSFTTSAGSAGEYRFTNGFIDLDTVVVYNPVASGSPYSGLLPENIVPSTNYAINAEKGVLIIPSLTNYGTHSLVVTYESGYEAQTDDESVLDVPFSLAQVALSAAVLAMNTHPSTPANRKDKTMRDVSASLFGYLQKAVEPMRRPRMLVEYPIFTATYE